MFCINWDFIFVVFRIGNRHGIRCQDGSGSRLVQLEQLRGEGRSNGREWLCSALQDIKVDEVRELARAAGVRVRNEAKVWIAVGDLRAALLEHLAPEGAAASEELAWYRLFWFFICVGEYIVTII